ncbi:uncharacterized protein MONOS_748 [Monocercomonoides exilis]|uniref:uncharacterized protein n=1 Tax=Monocercomonoides exilis TaxID=2049356 RepID=UPI00355AB560|nr:hypothetical protein MONOS_748 [Monocercomonoides exilis]|eukprot:MONOS_748.1-p1 / transcript=MONOS_748.1 / gene=MONOS_748 / organism=Monocercomonoides_exilis_PA203 / gene_product=unspecified product / transcript_product=unspecified product / location=Mono_scaffold00012:227600-229873(-) / protein_length=758 / sequence_SO=supercontig / SO=protein_coding / is_pseudo=false
MGTEINIQGNDQVPSVGMIHVTKTTKMSNISFCLPASLPSTSTLIACSAESLELKNCGAKLSNSGNSELEYCFVRASHSTLVLNTFTVNTQLSFASNSMIVSRNGCSVNLNNCSISEVEKSNGNGGFFESAGRNEGNYSCNIIVDNCTISSCKASGNNACGGGLFVELKENEKLIVNGSTTFDGCLTACVEHDTGKGGAVMISVNDASASFSFGERVLFSQSKANNATFGKDLFISCGTGIFLKEKTNFESLLFFDSSMEPDDLNQMSGTENGEDEPKIPIFVYFCSLVSSIQTDGNGGIDHPFCGFKGFMCKSIDYSFKHRISPSVNEVDVDSTSFINNELIAMNCHFCLTSQTSGASVSFDDKGDNNCEALIVCELNSTVEISNLELSLPDILQQKHISILESSSILSLLSISFVSINESISRQFGIFRVLGGNFSMLDALFKGIFLFFGRSAIEICNEQVSNLNNCSLIGVKQYNGDGGCISVNLQIPTPTSVFFDNCTVSGECAEGKNLKGGGIFASLQSGVISIQNTMFDECKVPSSGSEANVKGIGGGLYFYAMDDETELSLNKVMFHGCSGWKGDCMFVDGNNLSFLIKKERFSFEWAELGEKDLMGFERSTTSSSVELLLGAFLTPFEGKGFVSGDGEGLDHSGCGLRAYPCRTVPHLLKRRFQAISSTTAEITFSSSYSIKDAFAIQSYSACFESEMEGMETVIEEDETGVADGLIETRNTVSFSCIKFSLPSQFTVERSCLFLCYSS